MLRQQVRIDVTSAFYRTPAIGRPDQPTYLNGVWLVEVSASPRELKFGILRPIEDRLGRVRTGDKYAARTIDLDVLLYGDLVLDDADCRIPAPEIRDRPFLVACLLELDPGLILPDTKEALSSLLTPDKAIVLEPVAEFTSRLRYELGL